MAAIRSAKAHWEGSLFEGAGQVSLGHFAVVGLAAYLTARWSPHGVSLPVLFLAVGAVGAAVMVVVGTPALRVRGLTLAVTTLGFAVAGLLSGVIALVRAERLWGVTVSGFLLNLAVLVVTWDLAVHGR